jgi:hypothetical protein
MKIFRPLCRQIDPRTCIPMMMYLYNDMLWIVSNSLLANVLLHYLSLSLSISISISFFFFFKLPLLCTLYFFLSHSHFPFSLPFSYFSLSDSLSLYICIIISIFLFIYISLSLYFLLSISISLFLWFLLSLEPDASILQTPDLSPVRQSVNLFWIWELVFHDWTIFCIKYSKPLSSDACLNVFYCRDDYLHVCNFCISYLLIRIQNCKNVNTVFIFVIRWLVTVYYCKNQSWAQSKLCQST